MPGYAPYIRVCACVLCAWCVLPMCYVVQQAYVDGTYDGTYEIPYGWA